MREKESKSIGTTEYTFSECCMRLIRSLIAIELLFCGMRTILSSTFENWVLSKEVILWIQVLLAGMILFNELIPFLAKENRIRIRVLCEVLLLGWLCIGTWQERGTLSTGFHAWFDDYVPYWNTYNGTEYFPYNEGGELGSALTYTVLIMMVCMVILRYVSECRIFLIVPNIVALCAGLLVDMRSDAKSLLISFAGVIVLYSGGWDVGKAQIRTRIGRQKRAAKRVRWQLVSIAAAVMVAGVVAGATTVCFKGGADRIPDYGPEFLNFQLGVEDRLMSLVGGMSKTSYDKDQSRLSNNKPEYSDETVLTIHSNQLPQGNLYLKSFCSSTYRNGTWEPLDDSYETEADAQGFDSIDLATNLQQKTYEKMTQDIIAGWIEMNYGVSSGTMRIDYEHPESHSALLPYLWNPSSSNVDVRLNKDGVWRKGKETSITFEQWMFPAQDLLSREEMCADTGDEDYQESEKWYAGYVLEHDRNGTDEVPKLKEYINRVRSAMEANSLLDADDNMSVCDRAKEAWLRQVILYSSYAWTDMLTRQCQSYANNLARSAVALEVRNQLFSDTEYNLYLDSLPAGTDPVEYFLRTSKEGYCMHYASAATLMLQELGVPARYASGFIVKQSAFTREDNETITKKDSVEEDTNQYVATVQDYCAHAWVEIYMDGIGWVPYEMTPGYTGLNNSVPTNGKRDEELKKRHDERKKELESQQAAEQPSQITESSQQATQQNTQTTQIKETQSTQTNPQTGTKQDNGFIKIILIIVLIVLLLGLLFYGGYRFAASYRKRLLQELQAKRNRNAVRRINRRIYRGLMKGRPMNMANVTRSGRFELHMGPLTDAEYADKLMKEYSNITEADWKQYMEIVKKCAFSHEMITDEEAAFCYRIYEKRRKRSTGV